MKLNRLAFPIGEPQMNVRKFLPDLMPQMLIAIALVHHQPTPVATYIQPDPDQATAMLTALDVKPVEPFKRIDLG
jgi:hypothetical protein